MSESGSSLTAERRSGVEELAYAIRRWSLEMVHRANASHIGGSLSSADILAVLYGHVLRVRPEKPDWSERDRFVLSKGHGCAALYAALALKGFFPLDWLEGYAQPGSILMGHASHKVPGVEWSTGSLGHGLGLAAGQAFAGQRKRADWRVYALLSDGEMDEGSTWEAILFAGHHRLDRLTIVIDQNGQQALGATDAILDLGALAEKIGTFGWTTREVNGHNLDELANALGWGGDTGKPLCVVARTVKGKGVSFMENNMEWHYRAPKTPELLDKALDQLAHAYGRAPATRKLTPDT